MKTVSTLIACIAGAFCWFFTFILFKDGAGPIGGANFLTWVLFFAPLGFFAPLMGRLFRQNNEHAWLWMLALFPLLSILVNVVLVLMIMTIPDLLPFSKPVPDWLNKGTVLIVIALACWIAVTIGLAASGRASPTKDCAEL